MRSDRIMAQPDESIDLAEAALLIAQSEYPDRDVASYLRRIDDLADTARERTTGETTPHAVVNHLSEFLFDEAGFSGNVANYYDPRNSYLNEVLDRKPGIPITLSVLYMEVARRFGITMHGAGMPGHFLLTYDDAGERIVIDAFHRGIILTDDDCAELLRVLDYAEPFDRTLLAPVSRCDILARILNNLKSIYVNAQDYGRALRVVDMALIVAPDSVADLRLREQLRRAV